MNDYLHIVRDGLWHNNPGLVQLLGLCPLLAVSTSVITGLGLGLATLLVLLLSNTAISLTRRLLRPEIRIPAFVLVIATLVTSVELIMNAYFHELYQVLGIFVPLIVTNCVIIGRAEAFASRNALPLAATDGFMMGAGFTLVLITLGGLRELVGYGTLLSQAHMMFGPAAGNWQINVFGDNYRGFLLAVLPPGAFIGLGLLIALRNVIDKRLAEPAPQAVAAAETVQAS